MEEIDFLDEVVNSDIKDETMDILKVRESTKYVIENEVFTNLMEPRVVLDKSVVDGFIKGEKMLNYKEDLFEESESDLNSESSYELFTPQHHCALCQKDFKTESAYKAHCTKYHPEAKRGGPKVMSKSPWDVTSLDEFLYYCCPECDIKHSSKSKFYIHAIDKHPESQEYLQSFKINEDSHWEGDDTFTMFDDDPIKEELINPSEPMKESDSGSDFESEYFRPKQNKKQYHRGAKRGPKRIPKQVDKPEVKVKPEEVIKQEFLMETEDKLNESEQFECLVCFEIFPHVTLLGKHLKLKHLTQDGVFKCDHCTKQFSSASRQKFFYHLTKEHGIGKFTIKCDKCDNEIFETSAKLRNHNEVYHPTKPRHVCDKCGKDFRDKQQLKNHLKRVHEDFVITNQDKVKECDTCHKEFTSAFDLNDHLKSCLPKLNDFKCKFCNSSWVSHLSLELHLIEEHNVLKFCCQVCGLAFKQKSDIKPHFERIHEKLSKHLCHKCDKSFYHRKELSRHLFIWHNEGSIKRDYKCDICGNVYAHMKNLKEHKIRAHDRSEILSCDRCNYTTYIKKDLLAHIKNIHEGYKPNKCELCGAAYLYKRDLIKHKERNHQIYQQD